MPILKPISTGNGFASASRIEQITAQRGGLLGDVWQVQVGLYPDLDHCRAGTSLLWQLYPTVPLSAVDPADVYGSLEQYLATNEGDFQGGEYVPDVSTGSLEDAKLKKWAAIKGDRVRAEDAGFDYPGIGHFQSDPESRQKLVGAALAAKIDKDDGKPYRVDWTLADNSVVSLDADNSIEAGQRLLVHLDAVHQESRRLYALIQAADTVEAVDAIHWGYVPEEVTA